MTKAKVVWQGEIREGNLPQFHVPRYAYNEEIKDVLARIIDMGDRLVLEIEDGTDSLGILRWKVVTPTNYAYSFVRLFVREMENTEDRMRSQ